MSKQARRYQNHHQAKPKWEGDRQERSNTIQLVGKTNNQKLFIHSLQNDVMTVGIGSAGVGKSFMSLTYAAKQLLSKQTRKIVLYRAYQPLANRTVGFLKGDANEKMLPYFAQQVEYLKDVLGAGAFDIALKAGTIELGLLEAVRGRSFSDAIVVVDEAQLLTPAEIQALVTRIGDNCQMILIGDVNQKDVKHNQLSGLKYLFDIIHQYDIADVGVINFEIDDCQRSGIVKSFLLAFDDSGYL